MLRGEITHNAIRWRCAYLD